MEIGREKIGVMVVGCVLHVIVNCELRGGGGETYELVD